jgi:hypothetical protein
MSICQPNFHLWGVACCLDGIGAIECVGFKGHVEEVAADDIGKGRDPLLQGSSGGKGILAKGVNPCYKDQADRC